MSVALNFFIVQNIRDAYLLESFVQVFGCGSFSIIEKSGIGRFAVSNFAHIVELDLLLPPKLIWHQAHQKNRGWVNCKRNFVRFIHFISYLSYINEVSDKHYCLEVY
jgi:hypothetical protein